jgi:hypothetical protein
VRSASVEELARCVVALMHQKRIECTAHVAMNAAHELRQVVVAWRNGQVLVVEHETAVMDGHAGMALRVRERVEPDVRDPRIPRTEERLT